MNDLIRFIQKNLFVIVFLLLEIVCIVMLTTSQPYQKRVLFNATNNITGSIQSVASDIGEYFRLKHYNNQLASENAALRQQLSQYEKALNNNSMTLNNDTLYEIVAVHVVSNSINQQNNYIVIDKGSRDGILKNMGVISPDGVAGVVTNTSNNYATVISILHPYTMLSVKFKNNQHIANLKWEGRGSLKGLVEDIPSHVVIKKNDTIVTSGHSFIFPAEIMVGLVDTVFDKNTGLKSALVNFSTDFGSIRNAYVIKNNRQQEFDSLLIKRPE